MSDDLDSSRPGSSPARKIVWGLVVVLAIVHYDFWYWDDGSLLAGFMPIGLFYHALISVLAAIVWALVVKYAWPTDMERWADAGESKGDPP